MRVLIFLLLTLILTACAATAPQKPQAPPSEEAQIREAEELVRYSLSSRLIANMQANYINQVSSFLTSKEVEAVKAETIVSEEIEKVTAEEEQRLLDNLVPIYRRYYTPEEIHQLLSFYQTEVARKSLEIGKQIAGESRQFVRLWHDNFGDELLDRVYRRLEEEGIEVEAKGQADGQ